MKIKHEINRNAAAAPDFTTVFTVVPRDAAAEAAAPAAASVSISFSFFILIFHFSFLIFIFHFNLDFLICFCHRWYLQASQFKPIQGIYPNPNYGAFVEDFSMQDQRGPAKDNIEELFSSTRPR